MEKISWTFITAACTLGASLSLPEVDHCSFKRMIHYYNELGCSPLPEGSACPTSFKCDKFSEQDKNKCWLNGQGYELGKQVIPQNIPCIPECSCRRDGNRTHWSCIYAECPEDFGVSPVKPGCYLKYELENCCSTGSQCVTPDIIKCEQGKDEYYEGQLITKTNEACKMCICNKDFREKPLCREIGCNLQFQWTKELRKGCAPIFYGKDRCCPIQWRCPHPKDKVIPIKMKDPASTNSTTVNLCRFGNLRAHVGDYIVREDKKSPCLLCKCQLPPHITCIQKPHCK